MPGVRKLFIVLRLLPLLLLAAPLCTLAAMSGQNIPSSETPHAETSQEAAANISGSRWPGILDHLLEQPLPAGFGTGSSGIHINYPSTGDKRVDADIREWVSSLADVFVTHLDENVLANLSPGIADINEEIDRFLLDDDRHSEIAPESGAQSNFELWGDYAINRPSPNAISVTFEIWNSTGGQSNLDILTLNYNLLSGQRLGLVDIFEHPDIALELMSTWARKQLTPRLGAARRAKMLLDGTEPLAENFSSLTLTPEGICINFQPYQVAPWNAGIQKVEMPLSELMAASPLLAIWDK